MKRIIKTTSIAALTIVGITSIASTAYANDSGWSVVPYVGLSQLDNQSATISGANDIANGQASINVDQGFTAGLGVRYDYTNSRWSSELGWEYRSNDSVTTTADGTVLPDGNYASNVFYVNGRYALNQGKRLKPWIGAGVTWTQEVDLDSEDAAGERSFSDSGSTGFQVMAGVDYKLSGRLYLTSELRYSSQTGLDLAAEEGGIGNVNGLDYQPLTVGIGIGYRF